VYQMIVKTPVMFQYVAGPFIAYSQSASEPRLSRTGLSNPDYLLDHSQMSGRHSEDEMP
jgi:hypothetical protein